MKEFSKEFIEIDGVTYTLFLNRKGIVAWEKFCKEENEKIKKLENKYKNVVENSDKEIELNDDTNPFDGIEEMDDFDNDKELIRKTYKRLYWIMLYTEHKLSISQVDELYEKAIQEYREEDILALGQQMIEDMHKDRVSKDNLKNLTALRPKK